MSLFKKIVDIASNKDEKAQVLLKQKVDHTVDFYRNLFKTDGFNFHTNNVRNYIDFDNMPPKEVFLGLQARVEWLEQKNEEINKPELQVGFINRRDNEVHLVGDTTGWESVDKMIYPFFEECGIEGQGIENILGLLDDYNNYLDQVKSYYASQLNITRAGVSGEQRVLKELSLHKDKMEILNSIRLEIDNTSVETDVIILSDTGIFLIEVKNFGASGSYKVRIKKDGQWLKEFPDGRTEVMDDVMSQHNRHMVYKEKFIEQELKANNIEFGRLPLYDLIVIGNENVIVENESDMPIMRTSQVYRYVRSKETELKPEHMIVIKEALLRENKGEKEYPLNDYIEMMEKWSEQLREKWNAQGFRVSILKNLMRDIYKDRWLFDWLNAKG